MGKEIYTIGDMFCGAGGGSTGVYMSGKAKVVFCINHDATAIRSHAQNYPECVHYTEDIRLFDEKVLPKVDGLIISAECTNYSKAKGGKPREADSRTLAEEAYRYIAHCEPLFIVVENVEEFKQWSPLVQKLDANGKPMQRADGCDYLVPDVDKNKLGCDYIRWVQTIKDMGYEYQSRVLNSADFGAYTSRKRYFGVFVKTGMKIAFPKPTHAKDADAPKYKGAGLEKWKPVRELLNLEDKGTSIFDRKKPLATNTLRRILAGLQKFVPQNENEWIVKFLSNNPRTGINRGVSTKEPLHTITTQGRLNIASCSFIDSFKSSIYAVHSTEEPLRTLDTLCNKGLVTVEGQFIDVYYGKSTPQSVDSPLRTITTVDRHSYVNYRLSLFEEVSVEQQQALPISEKAIIKVGDYEVTKQIKLFMQEHGIQDILMRMLDVDTELKVIQGFPKDYILLGNATQRKKHIGNSIVPLMICKIVTVIYEINN